jgi:Zn-dependent protease with chaperone function
MRFLVVLGLSLLIPVLALALAAWPYVTILELHDPLSIARLAGNCMTLDQLPVEAAEACSALRSHNLLGIGALVAAGLVTSIIVGGFVAALLFGWSRMLLALSFPAVAFAGLIATSAVVFVEASLLAGGLWVGESFFLGSVHPVIAGIVGIFGALAALGVLWSALTMFKRAETSVMGIPIEPIDAPHIHRMVLKIARELKTKPPNNIVVGLDPTFFATSAKVNTPFRKKALRGRTIYLSLPLMRMLSRGETRSILGHEMAHFTGGDTLYSKRFAPAYRGLSQARKSLSDEDGNGGLAFPAVALIDYILFVFSRAERTIGRKRELRADKLGAGVGSPLELSTALVKLSVLSAIWHQEFGEMINRVQSGRFSRNISKNFAERVRYDVNHDKVSGLAALSLEAEVAHPTDTHPVTSARIEALGIDPDELVEIETFKANLFPAKTVLSASDNIDQLEEALTDAYQQFVIGLAGSDQSEENKQKNAFSNMLSMFLARMVTIDGVVDEREILIAQQEAAAFGDSFDATYFKELCRHPENIPETEILLHWGNIMLTEFGADKLKDVLKKIALSDNDFAEEEMDYLELLDEELIGEL